MGTTYTVQWPRLDNADSNLVNRLQSETNTLLKRVNQQMSTYQKDSELSVFNTMTAPAQMDVSTGLIDVVGMSLSLNVYTHGYFDISVGPIVNLWGFGPDKMPLTMPTLEQKRQAKSMMGLEAIKISNQSIQKTAQRYLDLSAIAKGYAVDKVAELLESNGIANYLVEIGGEMRVAGEKAEGQAWKVAIEKPDENLRSVQKVFEITDAAMATSGDYRNFFEMDGEKFSHSIDPFTAMPVKHSLASVTIIDKSCARADALATAMLVMGAEKAKVFAEHNQIKAYLIERVSSGFKEYSSPAFKRWQIM
ncbi:FAD:protein FMN transferase [Oceaniserpentilla sp. 4NH20-0058]